MTKEDISHVTEEPASTTDKDLSYEARLAYRKAKKTTTGGEKCSSLFLQILRGEIQTKKRRVGAKWLQSPYWGEELMLPAW